MAAKRGSGPPGGSPTDPVRSEPRSRHSISTDAGPGRFLLVIGADGAHALRKVDASKLHASVVVHFESLERLLEAGPGPVPD